MARTRSMPNRTTSVLKRSAPLPLYHQVAEIFRQRIADGEWRQGEKLPSLDALIAELGVARVTVREAIKLLRNDGLLKPERGRGTVVTAGIKARKPLQVETAIADLLDLYRNDEPEVAAIEDCPKRLNVKVDQGQLADSYYYLKRAHNREGLRYCIISLYISQTTFEKAERDFRTKLALPVLFALPDVRIERAWQRVMIEKCDAENALELGYPLGDPIARIKRYLVDSTGELIYFADVRYRGDCIHFEMDLKV
ncbi:MAG: GntR family transcriptional regulator [Pseudomonadota bacterium]